MSGCDGRGPVTVPPEKVRGKHAGEAMTKWDWTEPLVWTKRMLAALDSGVKGGKWYSLIDKLHPEATLRAAFEQVKANRGAAGCQPRQKDAENGRENLPLINSHESKTKIITVTIKRISPYPLTRKRIASVAPISSKASKTHEALPTKKLDGCSKIQNDIPSLRGPPSCREKQGERIHHDWKGPLRGPSY